MKTISIADMTLKFGEKTLSFKEKIEIARHLDNLKVSVIDMPEIINEKADVLLVRTILAFIKNSIISVGANLTKESTMLALKAIENANNAKIRLCVPVSIFSMEYTYHKKPAKLLEVVEECLKYISEKGKNAEIYMIDATRMDKDFAGKVVALAKTYGVTSLTLSDDEGVMLPDEFKAYIADTKKQIPLLKELKLGISCKNTNAMAVASSLMAIKEGIEEIKTAIGYNDITDTKVILNNIVSFGKKFDAEVCVNNYELNRIISQVEWILGIKKSKSATSEITSFTNDSKEATFDKNDSLEAVSSAVKALGYDLSDEDYKRVYEEFLRVASIKSVGNKELDAIVSSVAMQVKPTYILKNFVINNGNQIASSAQITLEKNGKDISGACIGDGPVDASFKVLEQIIGSHFELDDFQIQSVTEGMQALGFALVKLRHNGKLFSGNGLSTDIIGSAIRAYINAVNKIVYEEDK